ncbi:tRNA wybutosine-synthesizing protein 3 homolog isoform X2 [Hydractinia symbiolongicarpus]|uniref:tRNA wybutosine-synthesizing protein 3 homolog isoform X2 n=1 Tax=Hydractinia symbiolongicarpus TaxID=13093 RepID=UPI00254A12BC|nr:tRNA wybutosine-synthesizing protein 3 homolog isoform X2 [Hydractinia symbiolongicarpus]
MNLFDKQKKECLHGIDQSRKGSFDAPIHELIVFINSHNDFFTTSSCSGRIVLFMEGETKKKGCKWLLASHDEIGATHIMEKIEERSDEDDKIDLKYEPFILHVQCRTLECAKLMLKIALGCGYRNSGIVIGKKEKFMLAVRSTHGAEAPLKFNKSVIVSNEIF